MFYAETAPIVDQVYEAAGDGIISDKYAVGWKGGGEQTRRGKNTRGYQNPILSASRLNRQRS